MKGLGIEDMWGVCGDQDGENAVVWAGASLLNIYNSGPRLHLALSINNCGRSKQPNSVRQELSKDFRASLVMLKEPSTVSDVMDLLINQAALLWAF